MKINTEILKMEIVFKSVKIFHKSNNEKLILNTMYLKSKSYKRNNIKIIIHVPDKPNHNFSVNIYLNLKANDNNYLKVKI